MTRSAVILFNEVPPNASAADADVLVQVREVRKALEQLGWKVCELAATLDLSAVECELTKNRPDVVFNLVESLGGKDRLASLTTELLEVLAIPFTGCRSSALRLSNDKLATKSLLVKHGLPTPAWMPRADRFNADTDFPHECEWIIKPVGEHASLGMDDSAVIYADDPSEVAAHAEERRNVVGVELFAEHFIHGREFNLSVIERDGQPFVLAPAEIIFKDYPAEKPCIVGYAAKWDESSFEYHHTPRTFEFAVEDTQLLDRLVLLARACWNACALDGYARVDFRVDEAGQPWILEINTNPCLSPEGGFAAALKQSEIPFPAFIDQMVREATRPIHVTWPYWPGETAATCSGVNRPVGRLRRDVASEDIAIVRQIVTSTGMFRPGEIDVAAELVEARLTRGPESGYVFVFLDDANGHTVGYACYGRNTLTVSSWDLYWIAVEQEQRGKRLGSVLLEEVERQVREQGGTRLYIETSHRPDYEPTRKFYEKHGYVLQALLPDFYAPGDGRAIFVKAL